MKEILLHSEDTPRSLLRDRAQRLRREATDAERKMWSHLRNHAMGVKFRRQHPIGNFIVDFISLEAKIVIELDGGQHYHDAEPRAEAKRTQYLEDMGYKVLRFSDSEVLSDTDAVLASIAEFL